MSTHSIHKEIKILKKLTSFIVALALTAGFGLAGASALAAGAYSEKSVNGRLQYLDSYSTGIQNEDGGVAEIVKYNSDNRKMYLVNGAAQSIDIVSIADVVSGTKSSLTLEKRLDAAKLAADNGFTCGDITSVDVSTVGKFIAVAFQGAEYNDNGFILILDYDGNYIRHFEAGVQPDMIIVTKDGNLILTDDEGEPREGYGMGAVDPKGSVTIVDISGGFASAEVSVLDFTGFDDSIEQLLADKVLIKPDTLPSTDFEPEYIALSEDGRYAYVSLQEANAIATIDLATKEIASVKGLGFKEHSLAENALDALKDKAFKLETQDIWGVYMPDSIAAVSIGGTNYILTANEGDAREWNDYDNVGSHTFDGTDYKIDTVRNSEWLGLDADKIYTFGARSFSIWNAATMELVYDSGSDFERITGELYPEYFNSSHTKTELDSRSGKKGPEPEEVQVARIDGRIYAFVSLERIGGVMVYDITNPAAATFYDYINVRKFDGADIASGGSLGPEGIDVISAANSPTGKPIVLVANEVSGIVDLFEFAEVAAGDTAVPKPVPVNPAEDSNTVSGTYTVKTGDSLSKIARSQLGSSNRWGEIYELNKDIIKNPSMIFPGQVLRMP